MKNSLEIFKNLEENTIEHIDVAVERIIPKLGDNPDEEQITANLLKELWSNKEFRHICPYKPNLEAPTFENDGEVLGAMHGRIDFIIYLDDEQEEYLGFEAKKLNVETINFDSNVYEYVKHGVMDFVTQKYSSGLPMGVMLGYVMNGDFSGLQGKIEDRLKKGVKFDGQTVASLLQSGPTTISGIRTTERFETVHLRQNSVETFVLRHTLLNCSKSKKTKPPT